MSRLAHTTSLTRSLTIPHADESQLACAVERARQCLLQRQQADGHWVGELQGDTILESEFILLWTFLGWEADPRVPKAARYILEHQEPHGGWSTYPGGPPDVSVSTKAYFALKLAGHPAEAPYLQRAGQVIRDLGGAWACNSFTRFYLALLGQLPYTACPAVPPEMIFLPTWCYLNLYALSSWTRTIVVPLSICYAYQPVRRLPPEKGIAELVVPPARKSLRERSRGWKRFFEGLNRLLKHWDRLSRDWPQVYNSGWAWRAPAAALRAAAVRRATAWLQEHFQDSDGVGAIFPPMVYTVICLRCLGYADNSPEMRWAVRQLEDLMIEEEDTLRLQPCFSPVWDTALALNALALAGGEESQPAAARALAWLLAREVRRRGDWSVTNPHLEPGGWFFEYRNAFYPDMDDTAMVLTALARWYGGAAAPAVPTDPLPTWPAAVRAAAQRAVRWLLGMQNRDGGWAAFDRDVDRPVLTQIPFADHNAILDPSCPDITGRVLEALGHLGYRQGHPAVDRAVAFLRRQQDPRGCWWGRWGVNYLYGTWQVLQGLEAIGCTPQEPMVRRAAAWLKQVQQPSGAWGESCRSYEDPAWAGRGAATASQTAWAVLGLLAAGEVHSPEVAAGIRWLLATQRPTGDWHEDLFTGTGFPRVFYLKYHLYSLYFPLLALAKYGRLRAGRALPGSTAAAPLLPTRPAEAPEAEVDHALSPEPDLVPAALPD
jgi:squalene-hopene/tetraprenyl-beta-curcumene cyclase